MIGILFLGFSAGVLIGMSIFVFADAYKRRK